jgi:hypothetical protein
MGVGRLLRVCVTVAGIWATGMAVPAWGDERDGSMLRATVPVVAGDGAFHSQRALDRFLDVCGAEVGYYAVQLESQREIAREADRPVCLGGMTKVFCLTELFRQAEAGLDLDTTQLLVPGHGRVSLRQAAKLMIVGRDNAAADALVNVLGREQVNALPASLGIQGLSDTPLPEKAGLHAALDSRLDRTAPADVGLAAHGTARGMAAFYEQLFAEEVVSKRVSRQLLDALSQHATSFSDDWRDAFTFSGQEGSILWTRPPHHYGMMGWALLLTASQDAGGELRSQTRRPISVCVWGEWFPASMSAQQQRALLTRVTDSLIAIMEAPQRAAKQLEAGPILNQL